MNKSATNVIIHKLTTEPEAWEVDSFWVTHQSGLKIWIGNGAFSCRIEKPTYQEFSFFDRFRVYQAIQQLHKRKA